MIELHRYRSAPLSFQRKRCGVEKFHNSTVQRAWRFEISRLRVSIESKGFTTHTDRYPHSR